MKYIVDIGAFILLSVLIGGGIWLSVKKERELPERVQKIQRMQKGDFQFSFQNMEEKTLFLDEYQGQVVLVHLWATWCPPCVEEIPELIELAKNFQKNFVIIAVSEESKEDIENFFSKFEKLSSNFVLSRSLQVQDVFSPQALPESYLLDQEGRLLKKAIGIQSWMSEDWKDQIQKVL